MNTQEMDVHKTGECFSVSVSLSWWGKDMINKAQVCLTKLVYAHLLAMDSASVKPAAININNKLLL